MFAHIQNVRTPQIGTVQMYVGGQSENNKIQRMCSRSTSVDPNDVAVRCCLLSLDPCRSKRMCETLEYAPARLLPIQMHVLYVRICSRSTPVDPNACLTCSNVLSLDPRRSKCASFLFEYAFVRFCCYVGQAAAANDG